MPYLKKLSFIVKFKMDHCVSDNKVSKSDNKSDKEINILSFDDKKKLEDIVNNKLSKDAHLEIFFFLKKNNIKYTSNSNGIFFNVNSISTSILSELNDLVKFCSENEKKLEMRYDNIYDHNI